jgi:hypothetical protein
MTINRTLAVTLKDSGAVPPPKKRIGPLWKGPETDGITFSLLSRFLCCRERFRLLVVEGLCPADAFNHRIEYGNMWHACEEALAGRDINATVLGNRPAWENALREYSSNLCRRYPLQQEQVDHWYNVCKVQFPLYVRHWSKQPDVKDRIPLLQEYVFDVPYKLPSGRMVRLRGKLDAVDLVGKAKAAGVYLQENKTKGDINEARIKRQLTFDLQTMLYLIALGEERKTARWPIQADRHPILGIRYNVVRRPLSGGEGSIRQHKPTKSNPNGESKEEFYARLSGIIAEKPDTYFMRWKVEISSADVEKFRRECLDPILEQLCDWWGWVVSEEGHNNLWDNDVSMIYPWYGPEESHASAIHWRHPFGVYNVLDEGGSSDLDAYLESGSEIGLQRCETLFSELQ